MTAEKRIFERIPYKNPIRWAYVNQRTYYDAEIVNYSLGGVALKMQIPLKPGTACILRVDQIHGDSGDRHVKEGFRSMTLADIRWCREVAGTGGPQYQVGAKYPGFHY